MDLTEEQIAEETRAIVTEPGWPYWPLLPVKNIHRSDPDYPSDREVGIILGTPVGDSPEEKPRRIYFVNLFSLKQGPLKDQLDDVPFEDFENAEAMVRAGWIGD